MNKVYTVENSEGYSEDEMNTLNEEFEQRWNSGHYSHLNSYYEGDRLDMAMKEFSNEVSKR